ncbi:MAG: hypothetical protein M1813_003224 [Trichoglossum hirsutum]|nr:MAG: hypothetical protein M1813_003224 [Trichoglossum hirsutum]
MPQFNPRSYPGVLHHFAQRLVAFEFNAPPEHPPPKNILLFIGGLGDGLFTVPYTARLARSLPPLSYTLVEVLLTSSYAGWGTGSVSRDAQELALCVSYFRERKKPAGGKIVLMGHSTGCQDTMEYLTGEGSASRPPVDGAVLQAPVSDREAIQMLISKDTYRESMEMARTLTAKGQGLEILPSALTGNVFGGAPCSALRWYSLASTSHAEGGDSRGGGGYCEDFFSSDVSDAWLRKTFGSISRETPICIFLSGEDEFMPEFVDKKALKRRWVEAVKDGGGVVDEGHSGILEGATHTLAENSEEVVEEFVGRVAGFLKGLES